MKTPATRRDLIYILAPSYTGSTLLTFLLAEHEQIATIGELKAVARGDLSTYPCSCGVLQRECSFWKQVAEEMQKIDATFTLEDFGTHFRSDSPLCKRLLRAGVRGSFFEAARSLALRHWPHARRQWHAILERNRQIIEIVCDLQQGSIFLDGSKDPIRLKFFLAAGYWDVKVIYLIRDGRGATNSFMRHKNVPMETAAREWCIAQRECDRIIQGLPVDQSITIHYEDLCRDPAGTLTRIYDFLQVDGALGSLEFRSSEHHILGNPMRLASTNEITLDEKWKDALTQEDLQVFERIGGKLNRSYGYSQMPAQRPGGDYPLYARSGKDFAKAGR